VKIKTISRSEDEYTRERPTELIKVHKNVDPIIHPFEKPREYVRALNAVKLKEYLPSLLLVHFKDTETVFFASQNIQNP